MIKSDNSRVDRYAGDIKKENLIRLLLHPKVISTMNHQRNFELTANFCEIACLHNLYMCIYML